MTFQQAQAQEIYDSPNLKAVWELENFPKSEYFQGDIISAKGFVQENHGLTKVGNASLKVYLEGPNSTKTILDEISTDEFGDFSFSFHISPNFLVAKYILYFEPSAPGYQGQIKVDKKIVELLVGKLPSLLDPPLKQYKNHIYIDKIRCNDNLVLILKYDGTPACVKPETKEKLFQRGWAVDEQKQGKSGTFYAQSQLTSVNLKKGDTIRVTLFSYAITPYSDNKWVQVFDERPKNSEIGIVEKSANNSHEFASTGHEILPIGITANKLFEEGYFVVYITADSNTKAGKHELSIVSLDENRMIIEKPLHVTVLEKPSTEFVQEKIFRVVGSGHYFGIYFDNISEQEYWKREDSRKPWPPSPILNITEDNIHPIVKKLVDAMWDPSGKYIPFEYDKNILIKEPQVKFSGTDDRAISDWLKKIHDQQFERNLDDSSTNYIRYQDKIYAFGGWVA